MTKFKIIALAVLAALTASVKLVFFESSTFQDVHSHKSAEQRKPPSSFWKTRPLVEFLQENHLY